MVAEERGVEMPLAIRVGNSTTAPAEIRVESIATGTPLVILRSLEVEESASFAGPPRVAGAFVVGVTGASE
jgi:hypothetical protein